MKKIVLFLMIFGMFAYAGVVDNIRKNGKLRIGVKYDTKPFGFKEGKTIKGFDLELSKLITAKIKEKENLANLKVFYKKVYPSNREQMLVYEEVDMIIATYTISDSRKREVAFSKPYFQSSSMILFCGEMKKGRTVGILDGSVTEEVVVKNGYEIKSYPGYKEMFRDFENEKIGAIASDKGILKHYKKDGKCNSIILDDREEYGIGLPKGDEKFKKLIDTILDELKQDGEYNILIKKWFTK